MNCKLCGGALRREILRSQDSAILRCPACGFIWRDPYRGCAAAKCAACADRCIDRLATPGFLEARLRADGRRAARVARLAGGDLSGLAVLELGAGLGCLASHLQAAAGQYVGLESSPVFYGCLRQAFPDLAGKVENALLPGPEHRGRFDLLVLVDVLQFAPKPLEFLREALLALKKTGRVYIEIPDESLMPLRAAARKALGLYGGSPLHHGHINFFTPRSLRFLLKEAGLRAETLRQTSIVADEDRLFLTLKRRPPGWARALSLAARLTGADTLVRLGNTVCVASRKKSGGGA
ncbi:MAG: class I SAM-dependent methyltransferase [Elusimicrobiales bacterium]|nr:class I SAM-dependent methyltransferase [Elusimicrobiales bacterium]